MLEKLKEAANIFKGPYTLGQKANYLRYTLSSRKEVLSYKPIVLSVVATGRCTLSCDMCPTHSRIVPKDYKWRQTTAKDMDFELFRKVLSSFREARSVHIIGAGEPMLNRDFFRMVDCASRRRKMEVKTFSNGTTIGENVENLLDSGLDGVTISINGHNKEEFSRLTNMPGSVFEKIYSDTKRLIEKKNAGKRKLQVKLSFIIDKTNYVFLPEMVSLAGELKADHAFLCNFLPCTYADLIPEKKSITKKDLEVIEFIRKFKNDLSADVKKKVSFPVAIDNEMRKNNCDVHFNQLRIDGDGNVSSCSMMLLNMENTGRIEDKDPWNSAFLVDMRRRFLKNMDLEKLCFYCPNNKGIEI